MGVFAFSFHQQGVVTDKAVYARGEPVTATLTDVRFIRHCYEPFHATYYRREGMEWVKVGKLPNEYLCLNGEKKYPIEVNIGVTCNVDYIPYPPVKTLHFTWRQDEYIQMGTVSECGEGGFLDSYPAYSKTIASAGTYKVVVGESEAVFEIREIH
ncbi:MAG: hypothetical protein ABH950_01260 [Candidatus Altiarchaeota archaeon]